MPLLSVGMVTAHAPNIHGVNVTMRTSGQALGWPVRVGLNNAADGLRISQRPLPGIGTWGIVAFPYGDERNGTWLCSILPSSIDAITTNNDKLDPFLDYESHFSGYWSLLDGLGNMSMQWPDGSYFTVASGTALPTLYRHTVDGNQAQQKTPLTHAERVSNVPNPFVMQYVSAAGTSVVVDVSGSVTVSGATNATMDLTFNGAHINVDTSGNISLNTTGVINHELNGASASDALVLVSKLVTWLANHTHTDPQGGVTGTPVQSITSGTIASTIAKTSN